MQLYNKDYSEPVGSTKGYAGFRNKRRLQVFIKLIPVKSKDDVLEIGPNNCLLLDDIKLKARSVIGIDANEEAVKSMSRPDLICADANLL